MRLNEDSHLETLTDRFLYDFVNNQGLHVGCAGIIGGIGAT